MKRSLRIYSLVLGLVLLFVGSLYPQTGSLDRIRERGYLLWGSDAEGGAPYVFPDPADPSRLIGFEVDLAEAIACQWGVKARQSQNAWDSLIPALERGDFDFILNGVEITPERRKRVLFSRPYYVYNEQLVVRKDETRIRDVKDLADRKVGTLSGSVAQQILNGVGGVEVKVYSGQAESYEDLVLGRLDAVLLDSPIAAFYALPNPKLKYAGAPVGEGGYGVVIRRDHSDLRDAVDRAIEHLLRTGELKRIYEKWGLWDGKQKKLFREGGADSAASLDESRKAPLYSFLPTLLKGAAMTIGISVVSMALAIALGLVLTLLRLYGPSILGGPAAAYIEVYRGTPLLVQIYILYYGLPNIGIALSPFAAAVIGLGMNYVAYEAEIYRAGIGAVPGGQMEAALSLGMPHGLAVRRIVLPQALRVALPGIANDFIALFKDSSLVSVIAMVELTKTYNILAATTLRFFELGLVVAILYFAMSYPLSILARRLEKKLKGGFR